MKTFGTIKITVNGKKTKIFFGYDKHFMFPKDVFFIFQFCDQGAKCTVLLIQAKSLYLKLSTSSLLGQFYKYHETSSSSKK